MKLFTTLLTFSGVYQSASAFTAPSTQSPQICASASSCTKTALFANPIVSRKRAFQNIISTTIATIAVGTATSIQPASAIPFDVEPEDALRYIKRAVKALDKLELSVTNNEYKEIRDAIRSPSFDLLRKNSGVLIQNGVGTEKDSMQATYKKFVTDFEALDNKCGIAVRAKKDVKIYDLYRSAAKELLIFADTAEKVTGLNSDSSDTVAVEKVAEVAVSTTDSSE
mmetsp:Transcript_36979/g.44179  ORF Transcript_36979/g.44179 Transcript_36979/m.44179 type:complete len:225 (-) Transcript_36979:111-785(-)|eukprot:CAMPEP_0198251208 /NCGR_PEP_ID=MMETSP1447-20131203/2110_1 /TAXON_ID=420782 /ORGANISM="Chaetoceros dichaeta, Strain CCMP1751" /LENGTH=224 /DNA_ID=CAMNT_0043936171 /DNA_START=92 /DNA_END=766 /DNA_ORIENTATION=-